SSLVLFCWIQNYTMECHEAQLFQCVIVKFTANSCLFHFARGSVISPFLHHAFSFWQVGCPVVGSPQGIAHGMGKLVFD
ncbi:MAG: hypothetical protein M0T76_10550, partial [Desulfobacteraceae bacterium]|nr:hypothetical protein [Desulfobacteraceae bacterium]